MYAAEIAEFSFRLYRCNDDVVMQCFADSKLTEHSVCVPRAHSVEQSVVCSAREYQLLLSTFPVGDGCKASHFEQWWTPAGTVVAFLYDLGAVSTSVISISIY